MPVLKKPRPKEDEKPSEERGYTKAYGEWFPPKRDVNGKAVMKAPRFSIERACFLGWVGKKGYKKPSDSPGPLHHFKEYVSEIWGRKECAFPFFWNPYAERILQGWWDHKFLACGGHASSGKSQAGALLAVAYYLIDSEDTKCFVTSTTLAESRQRIWGVVEGYWNEACKFFGGEQNMPGKLISSRGVIRGSIGGDANEIRGIALIAGDKSQEKDSIQKLIGFKAPKMLLVADELPLLSDGVYNAAKGNLFANDNFRMIGIGNPASYYDPFGVFAEPEDGWTSIDEHSMGWKTKLGYCIRFDGLKSPNIPTAIYPGLLTLDKINEFRINLGAESAAFWRMVRGFWSPTGELDCIYTEQMITSAMADKKVTQPRSAPIWLAFLDPSFSHGGDKAIACFGRLWEARNELFDKDMRILELVDSIDLSKRVNVMDENKDRNIQLAEEFHKECVKRGVSVTRVGVDATGGGDPFASLMSLKFGQGFLNVGFGGAPSDKRVSQTDKRTGKDRFGNRVSELWGVGRDYIRAGQIKGLDPDTIRDLTARTYDPKKPKMTVESKKDMKKRIGRSPDRGDSVIGLLEVARTRCGFMINEKSAKTPQKRQQDDEYGHYFAQRQASTPPQDLMWEGASSWG